MERLNETATIDQARKPPSGLWHSFIGGLSPAPVSLLSLIASILHWYYFVTFLFHWLWLWLGYETDRVLCFCLTFTWPQAGASLLYYCGSIFSWLWKSWTEQCSVVCYPRTIQSMYKSKFTSTTSNIRAALQVPEKIAMHMDDAKQEQKHETVLFPIKNTMTKLMSHVLFISCGPWSCPVSIGRLGLIPARVAFKYLDQSQCPKWDGGKLV